MYDRAVERVVLHNDHSDRDGNFPTGRPEGIPKEVKKYLVACGVVRSLERRKAS